MEDKDDKLKSYEDIKRSKSLMLHRRVAGKFEIYLSEETCSTLRILLLTSSDRTGDSRNGSLDLMMQIKIRPDTRDEYNVGTIVSSLMENIS